MQNIRVVPEPRENHEGVSHIREVLGLYSVAARGDSRERGAVPGLRGRPFHERPGFETVAEIPGYPPGHAYLHPEEDAPPAYRAAGTSNS